MASLGAAPLALALVAMLAYAVAALPAAGPGGTARWPAPALVAGWLLHAVLLVLDVGGWGRETPGARLGFGPVLSLTVWLVVAVHAVESRFVPLPAVRRVLAVMGAGAVLLAWAFPGGVQALTSPWAPLHWVLGVASYGLFGAAVLHASMLDSAERALRSRAGLLAVGSGQIGLPAAAGAGLPGAARPGPMGMPLLRLERLTFRFVEAGFAVLTAALVLGVATAAPFRFNHKTVFSLLGWAVFAALLVGRHRQGWRGRRATRWLYGGALLLLLAYAGSRFVFEVVLGRSAG
ncbi:cytochrome C assembly family protein [Aquabacterium sp. OR-4]|uniref:cytochrome C assembly family protein n=1 Tax=Aquabacterium sp. OR-4 TaxID=2978127 RepID=UPI0021B2B334|nr:cytochrome c biogenesis protein CcsA [Aquabacterium sp. OR-4]MDT7837456.1 cytochrome c biogenesis protein CcsA [Aquabacterium sp. OR-4]